MLTVKEIREKLKSRKVSVIQRECGLSYAQVYGIASGKVEDPSHEVVRRLSEYFEKETCHDKRIQNS